MANMAVLVAVLCMSVLATAAGITITPDTPYDMTSGAYNSTYVVDLVAQPAEPKWVIIVSMAESFERAVVKVDGRTIASSGSEQVGLSYEEEVAGGTTYNVTVQSTAEYSIEVSQPASLVVVIIIIVVLVIGGIVLLCIGKRTMLSARQTDDRVVLNYNGCVIVALIASVMPLMLLIVGAALPMLLLQILGGVGILLVAIVAGRRTVDINATLGSVTITPYYLFVVPCCRKVVPFTDIANFTATIKHIGEHSQVAYDLEIVRVSGGTVALGGGGKKVPALLPVLNAMIRRVTPDVARPEAPGVQGEKGAIASVRKAVHTALG